LPVLPLHDVYPWYLFIPDLLDRGLMVVFAAALWQWAATRHRADERLRDWSLRQRRRTPVLLRWHVRRLLRWWRGLPPRTVALLAWLGLVVAAAPHFAGLPLTQPLNRISDIDGLMKLRGIAADPSWRAVLGYFVGDDPQGVHTFRPFPAATLWLEWHLWGYTRWAYMLSNMVWLLLTAGALRALVRRFDVPEWVGWLAAAWLLARPTDATESVTILIATRHDLTCGLCGLLALTALVDWLREGSPRRLAGWFGWSMLAYLSKEMAIALVAVRAGRRVGRAPGRTTVATGRRRGPGGPGLRRHLRRLVPRGRGQYGNRSRTRPISFGGMLQKLAYAYRLKIQNTLYHLCGHWGALPPDQCGLAGRASRRACSGPMCSRRWRAYGYGSWSSCGTGCAPWRSCSAGSCAATRRSCRSMISGRGTATCRTCWITPCRRCSSTLSLARRAAPPGWQRPVGGSGCCAAGLKPPARWTIAKVPVQRAEHAMKVLITGGAGFVGANLAHYSERAWPPRHGDGTIWYAAVRN